MIQTVPAPQIPVTVWGIQLLYSDNPSFSGCMSVYRKIFARPIIAHFAPIVSGQILNWVKFSFNTLIKQKN